MRVSGVTPKPPAPLSSDDPRFVGSYRLEGRLGAGAMGRVYLGWTRAGRQVAVKIIHSDLSHDPEFRQRFRYEVEAARRVQALYTAPVLDADPDADRPWLATTYVPGRSVFEYVQDAGPLPPDVLVEITAGVAEALQAIHDARVVHADLKPGNVLLAEDGPRVIDFGIARAAGSGQSTRTGTVMGTIGYMSPEQILGEHVGPASDMFALGALVVYMATGRSPFGDGPREALLFRSIQEKPDPRGVPEPLRDLVERCLSRDVFARPTPRQVVDWCVGIGGRSFAVPGGGNRGRPAHGKPPRGLLARGLARGRPAHDRPARGRPAGGGSRRMGRRPALVASVSALAVLSGVGSWSLARPALACERVPLNVTASPDIAPVVERAAARFNKSTWDIGGACAEVKVSPQLSADVADGLIRGESGGESSDGSGGENGRRPDVWIADSAVWPDQVRATGPNAGIPARYTSIAASPTVIAMPVPVARQLGGSGGVGWRRLLQDLDSARPPQIGFPDPTLNTPGLATLLAIGDIIGTSPAARARQVSVLRSITNAGSATRDMAGVFGKLPRSRDNAAIASSVGVLPATEQSVWQYNARRPVVPLQAAYPPEGALQLDYPYVTTLNSTGTKPDSTDTKRRKAAESFLGELRKSAARKDLRNNGFRTPDGVAGDVLNPRAGVNTGLPRDAGRPDPAVVATALRSWRALNLATRMLVLMDVSGSMVTRVAGVNRTRMEVTLSAAQQGLGLLQDTSELGLWTFSSQLDGNRDHRELISVGPLSQQVRVPAGALSRRGAVANALTTIQAKPGGATGLYDSILAAYRVVRNNYQPNKVNSVLVFTDGRNEDPTGGLSLDELLAELKENVDPRRPVPVFIVAFGPDTDIVSARRIAELTTGTAYQANAPGEITTFFLDAVGQRQCRPNCK